MIIYLDADVRELVHGVVAIHVECALSVPVEKEVLVKPLVEVCNEDVVVLSCHQDGGTSSICQGLASFGFEPPPVDLVPDDMKRPVKASGDGMSDQGVRFVEPICFVATKGHHT
jgi:hypothetical protein